MPDEHLLALKFSTFGLLLKSVKLRPRSLWR